MSTTIMLSTNNYHFTIVHLIKLIIVVLYTTEDKRSNEVTEILNNIV